MKFTDAYLAFESHLGTALFTELHAPSWQYIPRALLAVHVREKGLA